VASSLDDLPDKCRSRIPVNPRKQKYFCLSESKIDVWMTHPASLAEGRIAIVTKREAGMRWTRRYHPTNDANADGEAAWFWHPLAGAKLATMLAHCADDGD
jgi:hypothetical protein